jgi:hypothetical protein
MGRNGPPKHDQKIHTVSITEADREFGRVSLDVIAEAVAFLHKDGAVVLENVIEFAHLDTLNEVMCREAFQVADGPDHLNFGPETRNMDQAPPPRTELMFKDIWCNTFAAAVLSAVFGPPPVVHYANGNTALKAIG